MLLTGFVVTTIMMHNTTQLTGLTWQDAGKPLNTQALPTKMFEENETSEDGLVSKTSSTKPLNMTATSISYSSTRYSTPKSFAIRFPGE